MIYRVNVHNFHSEFVDQYLLDQHGKTNLITHGTGKNPLFGIKLFFWGGCLVENYHWLAAGFYCAGLVQTPQVG